MTQEITMLPNSIEVENSVIGILLGNPHMVDDVVDILNTPDIFYSAPNRAIYTSIVKLNNMGYMPDHQLVQEDLRKTGVLDAVGGLYGITQLIAGVHSIAPIFKQKFELKELYLKREQIRVAHMLMKMAYDQSEDVFDTFEKTEQELFNLSQINITKDATKLVDATADVIKTITDIRASAMDLTGAPIGFKKIENETNGWQDTDLIILAARPAVGKTALALKLGYNACVDERKPTPTAVFNMEMGKSQLAKRMLSSMSGVPLFAINKPKSLDATQMSQLEAARKKNEGYWFLH